MATKSADVYSKNDENKTALMIACEKGHLECLKMLPQAGAEVRGFQGITPLLKAISPLQGPHSILLIEMLLGHIASADLTFMDERL